MTRFIKTRYFCSFVRLIVATISRLLVDFFHTFQLTVVGMATTSRFRPSFFRCTGMSTSDLIKRIQERAANGQSQAASD
jgi:hypothetical protein